MSYYLRVESVNLSYFIDDTNDLSTIRGGGLLLLEAMEIVEEIIKKYSPKKAMLDTDNINQLESKLKKLKNSKSTKTSRKKIKAIEEQIRSNTDNEDSASTITKGASWGLFNLDMSFQEAYNIKNEVINFFNKDQSQYQHATIVVDLHINNGFEQYQNDRDSLQTLNHWQQMQAPSLAICKQGSTSCAIDKVRPATENRYLKDKNKDYVSDSVHQRREYGRNQKQAFYKKTIQEDKELTEKIANIKFTENLKELSQSRKPRFLDEKIAYIYIDGNKFGDIQRKSKSPDNQQKFDQNTRTGREKVLTNILNKILANTSQSDWRTEEGNIRLETLLWGGDEIIWVVPAWQGWWMINEFYKEASKHIIININDKNPLFHAAGLVFCHHNAPIHRINALARNLADQFAKEACRNKNYIAYQVLESFDHAGTQLKNYRGKRIKNLGQWQHLLVEAEKIDEITTAVTALKNDTEFAQRKIYQILHAYKSNEQKKAEQYIAKLPEKSEKHISELKNIFGNENAHWLHLIDLWNYID
ncbi:MAG: hypothetical protein KAT04_01815 [Methylococcales bacterium]|nr:hypothetical protein [Methylococcales bacterium]